jgi:DNA-binding LacI/PurR family transcriptional regulator
MLKSQTKREAIERSVLRLILQEGLKNGDAIMSENKMAVLFGVSRGTVSQAVSSLEAQGVLRSEQGRGIFVVDLPATPPDDAPEKASGFIGFTCYGGIDNIFTASLARGMEEKLEEAGFHLCVGSVDGGAEREELLIRKLIKQGVKGLIIAPAASNPPSEFLRELVKSGIALVFINSVPAGLDAPSVRSDDQEGAVMAVEALIAAGHRRIAHLRGPSQAANAQARLDGYRIALVRAGLEPKTELAPSLESGSGYDEPSGKALMKKLLALPEGERPTAVFATNDAMAVGAWEALKESGLSVPEDFSLIGYGNNRAIAGLPLSTVEQHPLEMGNCAAELLLRVMDGDPVAKRSKLALRTELITGSSISEPKTGRKEHERISTRRRFRFSSRRRITVPRAGSSFGKTPPP